MYIIADIHKTKWNAICLEQVAPAYRKYVKKIGYRQITVHTIIYNANLCKEMPV